MRTFTLSEGILYTDNILQGLVGPGIADPKNYSSQRCVVEKPSVIEDTLPRRVSGLERGWGLGSQDNVAFDSLHHGESRLFGIHNRVNTIYIQGRARAVTRRRKVKEILRSRHRYCLQPMIHRLHQQDFVPCQYDYPC